MPRGLRNILKNEEKSKIPEDKRILINMRIFNGIKGSGVLAMIWGFAFYFVWFSPISNPREVDEMRQTLTFTLFVSSTVYFVPLYFFVSGFLQTFQLIFKAENGEFQWSAHSIGKYCLIKVFRYYVLNVVIMLLYLYILPFIAYGPVWHYFGKMTEGCNKYWWTNMLWINNIYPRKYEDKCLPWTWNMAAYV